MRSTFCPTRANAGSFAVTTTAATFLELTSDLGFNPNFSNIFFKDELVISPPASPVPAKPITSP